MPEIGEIGKGGSPFTFHSLSLSPVPSLRLYYQVRGSRGLPRDACNRQSANLELLIIIADGREAMIFPSPAAAASWADGMERPAARRSDDVHDKLQDACSSRGQHTTTEFAAN
jgi:hypothetical protein